MEDNMQERARSLRKKSTDAENYLWYYLRSRNFNGYKFRRQYVIGYYIVDFICIRKKLIIELDGGQHIKAIDYDKKRTDYLSKKGYRVLRFWNNEVFNQTEGVLALVLNALNRKDVYPHPVPLPH